MDALGLMRFQLDDAAYQLEQVLAGFPVDALDEAVGSSFSPRSQVAHLAEAYIALIAHAEGRKHNWGSYHAEGIEYGSLVEEMWAKRKEAIEKSLKDDEDSLQSLTAYVVGHDYYHVGQLCTARIAAQPDWNPYAIYR